MNDVLYSSVDNVLLCELMMFCCDAALPKLCFIEPILFRCGKVSIVNVTHNYCFHYFEGLTEFLFIYLFIYLFNNNIIIIIIIIIIGTILTFVYCVFLLTHDITPVLWACG